MMTTAATRDDAIYRSTSPTHVVGRGAVTGYGWGIRHLTAGFDSGESAVVLHDDLAGYVDGGRAYLSLVSDQGARPAGPSRFTRIAKFAAEEAVEDALARGWVPGSTVGVVHAQVLGDAEMWRDYYQAHGEGVSGRTWVRMMPSTVLTMFQKKYGFTGPAMGVSSMCISGATAMLVAKSWLDQGICSDVIVLNSDLSGLPENLRHFVDIGAASLATPPLESCRPFQEGSTGFVGGEASVAMVLSQVPRGLYASILGGAQTSDAWSAVSINPDHVQIRRCFDEALASTGVDPSEVRYMNAHGPGTKQCDAAEAEILDTLFPEAEGIFSVKPLTGHCQAAAAGVELLATLYAFETGVIPAPPQVAPGHPRLIAGCTEATPGLTVKSSIGFGGNNAVLLIAPPEH